MKLIENTQGWRLQYRFTLTGRRRTQFVAPDGILWEETTEEKATHVRKYFGSVLCPTYLRQIGQAEYAVPQKSSSKSRKRRRI